MFSLKTLCSVTVLMAFANTADAGWVLFHQQGKIGQREAWFAEITRVSDRTEIENMLGKGNEIMAKTSIKELPVIVIYEAVNSPEWNELKIQFECVNKYRVLSYSEAQQAAKIAKQEGKPYSSSVIADGWNDPQKWKSPVNMRIAARSYTVPRVDLSNRPIPQTPWALDGNAAMIKAQKFACQEEDVRNTLRDATANGQFNTGIFNSGLQNIGLQEAVHPLEAKTVIDLLNLSWEVLWKGSKRADPSGLWVKKLSPEDKARNEIQYAAIEKQMKKQMDAAQSFAQPKIEEYQAEQEFLEVVRKVRGNRQVGQEESTLLSVWQGKPEEQVGASMGAPQVSEAGGLKFLNYQSSFDNRSALVSAASGRVLSTQGASGSCRISFITAPDRKNIWRVADIRIDSQGEVGGGVCRGLWRTPENLALPTKK
nr:hypothetical protein [uncultured Undibacterium sp.]